MTNAFFLIFFALLAFSGYAQQVISESFDQNTFQHQWYGDTAAFVPMQNSLSLQASKELSSVRLIKPYKRLNNTCWSGTVQLAFDPSPSNYLQIFLHTDHAFQQAYWLRFGGDTGDEDRVQLVVRQHGVDSVVFESTEGSAAKQPKLSYSICQLSDSLDITIRSEQDTSTMVVQVPNIAQDGYFVLQPNYTASRADKFIFDDLEIQSISFDDTPPVFDRIEASADSVCFYFSEYLSLATFQDKQVTGVLENVCFGIKNNTRLQDTLKVDDLEGNSTAIFIDTFIQLPKNPNTANSLWITEVMADPFPSVGLPDAEYIEIFNPNEYPLNLDGVMLRVGTKLEPLKGVLGAEQHGLLVEASDRGLFGDVRMLDIASLPTLRNTGQEIALVYQDSEIFKMQYDENTYGDASKKNGGFSLALQSYRLDCAGVVFRASNHPTGGSPGSKNIVREGTKVNSIYGTDTLVVGLEFPAAQLDVRVGDNWFGMKTQDGTFFTLPFEMFSPVEVATIQALNIIDCLGNASVLDTVIRVGSAAVPKSGQVLISEVHAAPIDNSEFIELHNITNRYLDISGLAFSKDSQSCDFLLEMNFIAPNETLVFTKDVSFWEAHPNLKRERVVVQALPTLNNDGSSLFLMDCMGGELVDKLAYSDNTSLWFGDERGFSLERNLRTGQLYLNNFEPMNASPTYIPQVSEASIFELSTKLLMPETMDPLHKELLIKISNADKEAQILGELYDVHGRFMGDIFEPFVLGQTTTQRVWDGRMEGQKVRDGLYLVYLHQISASGKMTTKKESISIRQ